MTHDRKRTTETGVGGFFPLTRWSLVAAASATTGVSREVALEELCQDYWYPLYAFARRSGQSAGDAEDLVQGFFLKLLEGEWFADADRSKGRLRTFLLTAFRRYQANEYRHSIAVCRGSGQIFSSEEIEGFEDRYAEARQGLTAEELYDRQWALSLLGKVIAEVEAEFADAGKSSEYEALKNVLMAERGTLDYGALAESLGVSEGAAKVAAHRLRKRFREKFRREIELTMEEGADLTEEIAFMAKVLAG